MKLEFNGTDLMGIDDLHVVEIDWPSIPPIEVAEIDVPAADGRHYLDRRLNPIDVTIKFRVDTIGRDPDDVMGRWTMLTSMLSRHGLCDLTVSRLISQVPEAEGYYIDLTYSAVVSAASNVDFKGYAGEASITFHIPYPVGEDRENAETVPLTYSSLSLWRSFICRLGSDMYDGVMLDYAYIGVQPGTWIDWIIGSYLPKIELYGTVAKNVAEWPADHFIQIEARYMQERGHFSDMRTIGMCYKYLNIDPRSVTEDGSDNINLSIDNDNHEVLGEVYTPYAGFNGTPILPTLESSWFDLPSDDEFNGSDPEAYIRCVLLLHDSRPSGESDAIDYDNTTLKATITPRWI